MNYRDATADDAEFLWLMLTYAASMSPGGPANIADAKGDPLLATFVRGWPREGDIGVVAADLSAASVGAAWSRLRAKDGADSPSAATEHEPELVVAVTPSERGGGVGRELVKKLLEKVKAQGRPAARLTVRETNRSKSLYEQLGFVVLREINSRDGGISFLMRCDLSR